MNAHFIEITYKGATNYRGSRVILTSHRFPNDRIVTQYDPEIGHICRQAVQLLEKNGYTVLAEGETKKGFFAVVAEFASLAEANGAPWEVKKWRELSSHGCEMTAAHLRTCASRLAPIGTHQATEARA